MKFFISTHVFYPQPGHETYGPAHGIYDFLRKNKKRVFFIKHDINGEEKSYVLDDKERIQGQKATAKNFFFRFLTEILFTIQTIRKLKGRMDEYVYIGVDPINGLVGGILRYFLQCQKCIYFSVDYSDRRYKNTLLNQTYFLIDRVALSLANEVWSVSSRIIAVRAKQGVSATINKLLPNAPDISQIKSVTYDGNKNLVIVSNLQDTLYLTPILQALKKLIAKHPTLHLTIIGSGPMEGKLKRIVQQLSLSSFVTFVGQKNHDEVISSVKKSFLGIAFYNPNDGNKYGDSMKVREYMACSIPVIMNDVPATADDVKRYASGLVLTKIDTNIIKNFIEKCITDDDYYKELRQHALKLGKAFDKEKFLQSLLLTH